MLDWLESHQIPCIYKSILGIECPTCGFQRAFIFLLKGDLVKSLMVYPALIPTLVLIVVLIFWLVFRKPGWLLVKRLIQIDLALIFVTYLVRLLG